MTDRADPAALQLAVILPTLNERDNLEPLLHRLDETLAHLAWEAIVVDDDSPDGTAEMARRLAAARPNLRVIQRVGRRGLASAALEGALATAAQFVVVMDADHQHDPALIPSMLTTVETGEAEVAVASRFVAGGDAAGLAGERRNTASRIANALARKLTGVELTDPMSGFFLIETARLRALAPRLSGIGFKILLDLLAAAPERLRVRELPLRLAQRRSGSSKMDSAIAFEFLIGLYDRVLGRIVPTRFALFGTVGGIGVAVHMIVLALVFRVWGSGFVAGQAIATFAAMTFNFWLNNILTYADCRLRGAAALLKGWAGFCLTCSVGALANVALAGFLEDRGLHWALSALSGILIGAVWNYTLSGRFVWGRY
jgi:dolichol-phosphate mannosyltransferase